MRLLRLFALAVGSLAVLSLSSPLLWWFGRGARAETLSDEDVN